MHTPLSLTAQTAYAQLHEALQSQEVLRNVAHAPGSFNKKQVAGKTYWYYQFRNIADKLQQIYLGPKSERLDKLIEQRSNASASSSHEVKALAQSASTLHCRLWSIRI